MALKFKPKNQRVRLAMGTGEYLAGIGPVVDNPGMIFAVIGPFDGHTDKQDLQDALEMLCRGFNLEVS